MNEFRFESSGSLSGPRVGRLHTPRGTIETPAFMPVGTNATVKALSPEELQEIGAQMILANTFHLYLRPGADLIARAGGLHRFMQWERPILTDSGGFQIFSLARLRRLTEDGVTFRSPLDGSEHTFTPERVLGIQRDLGSDLVMPLDICSGFPMDDTQAAEALRVTLLWARRSKSHGVPAGQMLFGIVQGGFTETLRREAAQRTAELDFAGYAIGGLSVGEPPELSSALIEATVPELPEDRPRYLMGVGTPARLLEAVERGIDLFDCALPTRVGRTGTVFTRSGRINLRNAQYREDHTPPDDTCACRVCRRYSRAYLRHLFNADEMLGPRLASYHNLFFLSRLMADARAAVDAGRFSKWKNEMLHAYATNW